MDFDYLLSDKKINISVEKKEQSYNIKLENEDLCIEPVHNQPHFLSFKLNGKYQKAFYAKDNGVLYVFVEGQQYKVEDLNVSEQKSVSKDHLLVESENEVCAPMPGKIIKIMVNVGDTVEVRQKLVIVEAMKMENNITSSMKGIVKKINFNEGDLVDTGQPIIELEAIE